MMSERRANLPYGYTNFEGSLILSIQQEWVHSWDLWTPQMWVVGQIYNTKYVFPSALNPIRKIRSLAPFPQLNSWANLACTLFFETGDFKLVRLANSDSQGSSCLLQITGITDTLP